MRVLLILHSEAAPSTIHQIPLDDTSNPSKIYMDVFSPRSRYTEAYRGLEWDFRWCGPGVHS